MLTRKCSRQYKRRLEFHSLGYLFGGNSERTQCRVRGGLIVWADFFLHSIKMESDTLGLLYFKTELKAKGDEMRRGVIV